MGDVEDPEIYAAEPLIKWQKSPYGQWCMENCEPGSVTWYTMPSFETYGYKCSIMGDLKEELNTFHKLKWGDYVNFDGR
jgi:hypothetical protein